MMNECDTADTESLVHVVSSISGDVEQITRT